MKSFITNLFQKFIIKKDIRNFKRNFIYYFLFRFIRKFLNSKLIVNIYNFKLYASNKKNTTSYSILRKCDFEDKSELNFIKKISDTNSTYLIDCGSNFGFYSLFVASLSKKNKITSVEASNKIFKDLSENIKLNNFQSIEMFNYAVSNKNDLFVELNESENDWESSISHNKFNSIGKTIVKTITIDKLMENKELSNYHLIIKIDVEGHEMNVIKGSCDTIKTYSPLIIIEFSKFIEMNDKNDYENLNIFLDQYDYQIYDAEYKKINLEIVQERINKLSKSMYGIGNNFLIKKNSNFEKMIQNV